MKYTTFTVRFENSDDILRPALQGFFDLIAANLSIPNPGAYMAVAICGHSTGVAVISLAGIVFSKSFCCLGYNKMSEAIIAYVKRQYNVRIDEAAAENIRERFWDCIAATYPHSSKQEIEVKGRDVVTGISQNIRLPVEEVREVITGQADDIAQAVRTVLEETPPELVADIVDSGIVLIDEGARLQGLDRILREKIALPITVVANPRRTKQIACAEVKAALTTLACANGSKIIVTGESDFAATAWDTASDDMPAWIQRTDLSTPKSCLAAVRRCGFRLKLVPEFFKTSEICYAAVCNQGNALEYVPEVLKTSELCLAAVQNNAEALRFVPEDLKTPEFCLAAVKK